MKKTNTTNTIATTEVIAKVATKELEKVSKKAARNVEKKLNEEIPVFNKANGDVIGLITASALIDALNATGKDDVIKLNICGMEREIVIPEYQRNNLAENDKKFYHGVFSTLLLERNISSTIVLAINEDGNLEIIDGLQRLSAFIKIKKATYKFRVSQLDEKRYSESQIEFLRNYDGCSLKEIKESEPEIYDNIVNAVLTVNICTNLNEEEREYEFYRINDTSKPLHTNEKNHAKFCKTPIWKTISGLVSKMFDSDEYMNEAYGRCTGDNTRFGIDAYVLKLAYICAHDISDKLYSGAFSGLIVGNTFLNSEDINEKKSADRIGRKLGDVAAMISDYGLNGIADVKLHNAISKKPGKPLFTMLIMTDFVVRNKELIENNCIDLNDRANDGKYDFIEILETYLSRDAYKASTICALNASHNTSTDKILYNSFLWKSIIEHAIANNFNEKAIDTFTGDDYQRIYNEVKEMVEDN